jgi:hypothetical protein
MTNAEYPTARRDDLVVQETDDEVLVYDLRTNKASCLNSTAALVWNHCDGTRDVDEITGLVSIAAKREVSTDVIRLALSQLSRGALLERDVAIAARTDGVSRRELVKRIGLTSTIALPVVASMVAPSAVQAQTCVGNDGACTTSAQCCSMCCKDVGGGVNQCKPGGGACLP